MKKTVIIIVILLVLGAGAYAFFRFGPKQANAPADAGQSSSDQNNGRPSSAVPAQNNTPTSSPDTQAAQPRTDSTQKPLPQTKESTGTYSSGEESMSPDVQVWAINFDGKAFSPNPLEVKLGDIVLFKNNSGADSWPILKDQDGKEYDPGKAVASGSRFQFQFTIAGKFTYSDKLNPTAAGVINVVK